LMKAIAQNPAMSQEEQQQVSKDLATAYQKQALAKLIAEVKK